MLIYLFVCLFVFIFLETGFHHIGNAGLKFLTSGDLPTLASQSAGITGVSHGTLPVFNKFFKIEIIDSTSIKIEIECLIVYSLTKTIILQLNQHENIQKKF